MDGGEGNLIVGMCSLLNYKTWSSCYVFFPAVKTMEKQLAMCWALSVGKGTRQKQKPFSGRRTYTDTSESLFPAVFKAKQHFNPTLCLKMSRRLKCAIDAGGAVLVWWWRGRSLPPTALFTQHSPQSWLHCWPGTASARAWGCCLRSHRCTETEMGTYQWEQKIRWLNTKQRRHSVLQEKQKFRINSIHVCHMLSVQQLP